MGVRGPSPLILSTTSTSHKQDESRAAVRGHVSSWWVDVFQSLHPLSSPDGPPYSKTVHSVGLRLAVSFRDMWYVVKEEPQILLACAAVAGRIKSSPVVGDQEERNGKGRKGKKKKICCGQKLPTDRSSYRRGKNFEAPPP